MDSSRTPNSILDWLLAGSIAFAIIAALAGVDLRVGAVSMRAHNPLRILAATGILATIRLRFGVESPGAWLTRIVLLTAICGSVMTWFRFLLTTVGGADSYGYASAGQLLAQGRLIDAAPIAAWLSAANRMAIASPLGWAPSPDAGGIVPTYPIGLPGVMALFSSISGPDGIFFVTPVMGLLTLACVHRLAQQWHDADTALLATAIAAWNPLVITYSKQPMSDMAASMWVMLGLCLAVRSSSRSGFAAGLAGGCAVMTRPVLLIAGALLPALAFKGDAPRRRVSVAIAGLGLGVAVQMVVQQHLFGSPFATGYGSATHLFAAGHVDDNAVIFSKHLWTVLGPLFMAGVAAGLMAAPADSPRMPAAMLAGVALPYLFYLPFDHWETLRFLLPGLVPLTIVAAAGLMRMARAVPQSLRPVIVIAAIAIVAGRSEMLLRGSSVWDVSGLEARYPLAGQWIDVNTPVSSVVLANQHSGSLRWYGKRQTLRWDFIEPASLPASVGELQAMGATVYVALEGDEVAMFEQRFAGVIDQLQVDHVGSIRNVSFRRLAYLPANR
ncbi:MAG: glycosyltransferase family 39 protein [Acidimicrobiia bacterium]